LLFGLNIKSRPGRERFPAKTVAFVTALIAIPPLIGFWGTFDFLKGYYASIYLAASIAWYLLGQLKFRCVSCPYYGKSCPRGLSKIAPLLFRAETGVSAFGVKVDKVFWPYWYAGVPAFGFLILLLTRFSWTTIIFAAAFAITFGVAWAVDRRYCCAECKCHTNCARAPFRDPGAGFKSC